MSGRDNLSSDSRARQEESFLFVGRVARPHGVRGALVVDAVSDRIRTLARGLDVYLGAKKAKFTIEDIHQHKKRYLMKLEGSSDRDQAEQWRDAEVFITLEELPPLEEGIYYYWQILDLSVRSTEGEHLGSITEILETGANDVYLIQTPEGDELLLPAIKDVVKSVDLEKGEMIVALLPGLRSDSNP